MRPCRLLETLTNGTVRLEFRCDREEGNEQGQLKPVDRLRQYLHECSDVHVNTLTHAQRLLLCENLQTKTGATATGMAANSSALPGPTTVNTDSSLLQKRAVRCSAVNQSDSQSELNQLNVSHRLGRVPASKDEVILTPPAAPTALSPHPNVETLDNRYTERGEGSDSQLHACEELPEIIAAIESDRSRLDSVDTVPRISSRSARLGCTMQTW